MKARRLVAAIGSLVAVACVLFPLAQATSARKRVKIGRNTPVVKGSGYLALGDSVTFGFQEATVVPPPNYRKASSFANYPMMAGKQLRLRVTNAACPGETSASFINTSAQSYGCENFPGTNFGYRKLYPLHVRYKGSQLAFAIRFLRRHRGVRLVSLMIGANDVFLCEKTTKDACLNPAELKAVFTRVEKNVRRILLAVRKRARYRGQIILVHYFSPNSNSALFNAVAKTLNTAMDRGARGLGVRKADGYGAFQTATRIFGGNTCRAGLVTLLRGGSCGVHPTYAGHALLAQALIKGIRI